MFKFITILVLASNIFALNAFSDQGLDKCTAALSNLARAVPRSSAMGFTKIDIDALFGVRDRMLKTNSEWTLLETAEESQVFSSLTGKSIPAGTKITKEQFESLVVQSQMQLARWFANKRFRVHFHILDKADLIQAAQIGILLAVRQYRRDHPTGSFSELMGLHIKNEINQLTKSSLPLYVPNTSQLASMFTVSRIANDLKFQNKGHKPSLAAIYAQYAKEYPDRAPLSMKKINDLLTRQDALDSVFSIFESADKIESAEYESFLPQNKVTPESVLEKKQASKFILQLFEAAHLDNMQKNILILRFGLPLKTDESNKYRFDESVANDGLEYREIGKLLGLSHEMVRQKEITASERIVTAIGKYKSRTLYDQLKQELGQKPSVEINLEDSPEASKLKRLDSYRKKYGDLLAPE